MPGVGFELRYPDGGRRLSESPGSKELLAGSMSVTVW